MKENARIIPLHSLRVSDNEFHQKTVVSYANILQEYCTLQYSATKNLQITLIILGNGTHVFTRVFLISKIKNKKLLAKLPKMVTIRKILPKSAYRYPIMRKKRAM